MVWLQEPAETKRSEVTRGRSTATTAMVSFYQSSNVPSSEPQSQASMETQGRARSRIKSYCGGGLRYLTSSHRRQAGFPSNFLARIERWVRPSVAPMQGWGVGIRDAGCVGPHGTCTQVHIFCSAEREERCRERKVLNIAAVWKQL